MELATALVGIGIAAFFASLSMLIKAFYARTAKQKWLMVMAGSFILFLIGIQLGAQVIPSAAKPSASESTSAPPASAPPKGAVTANSLSQTTYLRAVKQQRQNTGAILSNLDSLFRNPKWDEKRWSDTAIRGIDQFNGLLDEAEQLVPPESMKEIQQANLENIGDWRVVLRLLSQAIANPETRTDPDRAFAQARERAIASAKKVETLISAAANNPK